MTFDCRYRLWMTGMLLIGWLYIAPDPTLLAQTIDSFTTRGGTGRDPLTVVTSIPAGGLGCFTQANVTISCNAGPSQSDRNLTVVLWVRGYNDESPSGFAFRKQVRLDEGSTQTELEIPFVSPEYYSFDVAVYENGREIEDKNATKNSKNSRNSAIGFVNSSRTVFALGVILPDRSAANSNATRFTFVNLQSMLSFSNTAATPPRLVARQDASSDWRTYMDHSLWIISADTLLSMQKQNDASVSAIRNYIAAGGRIAIASTADVKAVDGVKGLLGDSASTADWTSVTAPAKSWWLRSGDTTTSTQQMGTGGYGAGGYGTGGYGGGGYGVAGYGGGGYGGNGQRVIQLPNGNTVVVNANGSRQLTTPSQAPVTPKTKADEPLPMDLQGIAFDAAIAGETWLASELSAPTHLVEDLWSIIGDLDIEFARRGGEFGYDDWMGSFRDVRNDLLAKLSDEEVLVGRYLSGSIILLPKPAEVMGDELQRVMAGAYTTNLPNLVDDSSDGNWFYRNLIGAVGKPPVWIFCTVVALFGALLGPGLLFFTARMGRRSLMILFVPALSFVATLSIVAYGVLHEGFETHIRTVSIQWIDAKNQSGFAWSRQNYFSGLPPRDGLHFSLQTYARQVAAGDGQSTYATEPRENTNGNIIYGDEQLWLNWLKPRSQQQLLVGHPLKSVDFPLSVRESKAGELQFTNQTDSKILIAVACDRSGRYYFTSNLGGGGSVVVGSEDQSTAVAKIARLMADIKPNPPEELTQGGGSLLSFGTRNRWSSSGETLDILNNAFSTRMSDRLTLPPGSAAILVRQTDNLEIPIQGRMDTSLHLVIGENVW